jgi:hypothetical protein
MGRQDRTEKPGRRPTKSILFPLDLVYLRAGIALPKAKIASPYDIPLPYRSLLVHESDMTLTLEQHFGGRVALRVLSTYHSTHWYLRRVLLVQEYSGRPVQMGAIRMNLNMLKPRIRAQVFRNEVPFGRILRDAGVGFRTQSNVFLKVISNSEMMGVFWMREPRTLYGRQTEVFSAVGAKIGDIIEVLPPV